MARSSPRQRRRRCKPAQQNPTAALLAVFLVSLGPFAGLLSRQYSSLFLQAVHAFSEYLPLQPDQLYDADLMSQHRGRSLSSEIRSLDLLLPSGFAKIPNGLDNTAP